VHRQPRRVEEVPVDDPGILLNLDTPDDVSQLP
jgi:CTP:molybdopterin cytidylyltransferase MocA